MTVIRFPSQRFTPEEINDFHQHLLDSLDKGIWAGLIRRSLKKIDSLILICALKQSPLYAVEKDEFKNFKLYGLTHHKKLLLGIYPDLKTALTYFESTQSRPAVNHNSKNRRARA